MHTLTLMVAVLAAGFPEVLTHPLLGKAERWAWPAPARFEAAWAAQPAVAPGVLVVRGALSGVEQGPLQGWFVVDERDSGTWLEPLATDGDAYRLSYTRWSVQPVDGPEWAVGEGGRLVLEERLASPLAREDLVAWTYASTLQATSGPLYTEGPPALPSSLARRRGPEQPDGGFDLFETVSGLHGDLEQVRAWAKKEKGHDALYAAFQAYRPIGGCSMDTHPQEAARAYAELAFERGDLGRFLQLQVRIMGDQFERVASSSYGEAAHGTEAARLTSTGIDVDQFLLGLGVARPGEDSGLDPWRLARSIREAGRQGTVGPLLMKRAQSPAVDPFNRLRALQTWVFLELGAPAQRGQTTDPLPVLKRAAQLNVGPLGEAWLAKEQGTR